MLCHENTSVKRQKTLAAAVPCLLQDITTDLSIGKTSTRKFQSSFYFVFISYFSTLLTYTFAFDLGPEPSSSISEISQHFKLRPLVITPFRQEKKLKEVIYLLLFSRSNLVRLGHR